MMIFCPQLMNDYFKIYSTVLLRRREFLHASQSTPESVSEFECRLRRLVQDCEFTSDKAGLLRDVFVIGIRDSRLGERLLAEGPSRLNFENALQKAEAWKMARTDRGRFYHASVNRIPTQGTHTAKQAKNLKTCYRCGSKAHLANSSGCPAK